MPGSQPPGRISLRKTRCWSAKTANETSGKTDREFLAYLAVIIGGDVPWIGVDSDQASNFAVDSDFFFDLTRGSLADGFTWFHPAAGDRPVLVACSADHGNAFLIVGDNDANRWHGAVSFRRGRIV